MVQKLKLKSVKSSKGKGVKGIKIDDALIEDVITTLVGAHAMPIIDFLKGKSKISEFIIAEELELEINETRNILYQLLEHNIVSFIRKKDRIKGWYICYWDFNENMIPLLKKKILSEKLEKMRGRLNSETENIFYMCPNACSRMDFDNAIEYEFKCPECGSIMNQQDNARTINFLKEKIEELESELALFE